MLSATPLRVLLFKEGLARFCTEPYKAPTEGNMEQACHTPLSRTPLATHPYMEQACHPPLSRTPLATHQPVVLHTPYHAHPWPLTPRAAPYP